MFDKVARHHGVRRPARRNFANWVCLLPDPRVAMMKAAVGLAFQGIDDRYRVGYSTIISEKTAVAGTGAVDIGTAFGSSQKTLFYHSKLNAAQVTVGLHAAA